MKKYRDIIVGIIIGMMLGGTIAYAATRAVLEDGSGNELGTATNPIYVNGV